MEQLPFYVPVIFGVITLLTTFFLYRSAGNSRTVLLVIGCWLLIQAVISLSGFYKATNGMPPRFLLTLFPPIVFISWLMISRRGKQFTATLDIKMLTLLHIVRVPVEIGLYFLSLQKVIPSLMTFEGRNVDIISGITAFFIYYVGMVKKKLPVGIIIAWNFICLGLLVNIVVLAILSAPFPFQQLAFEQPNIAILYFPFTWLPCFIVPAVLYAHLVTIQRLLKNKIGSSC